MPDIFLGLSRTAHANSGMVLSFGKKTNFPPYNFQILILVSSYSRNCLISDINGVVNRNARVMEILVMFRDR
jgi:hypothetical protein